MRLAFIQFILIMFAAQVGFVNASEEEEVYDALETELAEKDKQKTRESKDFKKTVKEFKSISDLADLSPFSDIAVINKKYLPKTKRFELSGQILVGLNNAFFSNLGANLHFDWYLNENWGLELSYYKLIDSEREITKNLSSEREIDTRSFVLPSQYYGAAIKWSPIYGKMALFEERIVSFDWFFTLGGGMTTTVLQDEPTFHAGFGQYLALNRNWAFRWDVNWHVYNAKILKKESSGSFSEDEQLHNDLFLGIGVSFFFPEVGER